MQQNDLGLKFIREPDGDWRPSREQPEKSTGTRIVLIESPDLFFDKIVFSRGRERDKAMLDNSLSRASQENML